MVGCTNALTSPPISAISRTNREDRKWYFSEAVRNMVSICGSSALFMLASWNSNSKSETARIPRNTTLALCSRMLSISNELNPTTMILCFCCANVFPITSRTSSRRSSGENRVFLLRLEAIPTITRSNNFRALVAISICPLVMGSKEPG